MSVGILFQRALSVAQEAGNRQLLALAVQKLSFGAVQYGSVRFFVRDLNGRPLHRRDPDVPIDLRLASGSDLPLLIGEGDPSQAHEGLLVDRFRRGDLCFLALSPQGGLMHSRWVTTTEGYIPELGMDLELGVGEAYMYGGYTSTAWRGRGIDGAIRSRIFETMRRRGFARVYSYVRCDNPPGLRAAERWQQPLGRARYIRLAPFRPWIVRGRRCVPPRLRPSRLSLSLERQRLVRIHQARDWFNGWLEKPIDRRSTGFHSLSSAQFAATGEHIAALLETDPERNQVLDVGCDSAMVSRYVASRCRRFIGVDVIPAMLESARMAGMVRCADGAPGQFVGADGTRLPFRASVFDKVYCSAVIHMLPSPHDGLAAVEEMLRVCRPGGKVLLASVPDRGKRFRRYLDAWRQARLAGKVRLLASLATPAFVKARMRTFLGLEHTGPPPALDYDLKTLCSQLDARGFRCRLLDFPDDYWSTDFRRTRSNVLIDVPARTAPRNRMSLPDRSESSIPMHG